MIVDRVLHGGKFLVFKKDEMGYIVDPVNTIDVKCGWGSTKKKALEHFIKRNTPL